MMADGCSAHNTSSLAVFLRRVFEMQSIVTVFWRNRTPPVFFICQDARDHGFAEERLFPGISIFSAFIAAEILRGVSPASTYYRLA